MLPLQILASAVLAAFGALLLLALLALTLYIGTVLVLLLAGGLATVTLVGIVIYAVLGGFDRRDALLSAPALPAAVSRP